MLRTLLIIPFTLIVSIGSYTAGRTQEPATEAEQWRKAANLSYYPDLASVITAVRNETGKEKDPFSINRKLFRFLHKNYFTRYDENAKLGALFSHKTYNCVTAVYLYATVLDSLKLPYRLWMTPIHIYLTFPHRDREVTVELTNPEDGFDLRLNESNVVDILEKSKMITASERESKGDREIIREFLEQSKEISMADVPSILLYNQFVEFAEVEDSERAFYALSSSYKQSRVIKDIQKTLVAVSENYGYELVRTGNTDKLDLFLTEVEGIKNFPIKGYDEILQIFSAYSDKKIRSNQLTSTEKWVQRLREWFPKEPLYTNQLDDIEFEIAIARYNLQLSARRYSALFKLSLETYSRFPQKPQSKIMLDNSSMLFLNNLAIDGNMDEAIEFADSLYRHNADHPQFRESYLYVLAKKYDWVHRKNPVKPQELEKLASKASAVDPNHPMVKQMIANNYFLAAQPLMKKEKYKEAKVKILAGLDADPGHIGLLDALRMVNEVLELKNRAAKRK